MPEKEENNEQRRLEREIEALLFASDTPLSAARLSSLTGVEMAGKVKSAVEALDQFYREFGRSFSIIEVAGGYQVTTLPEFASMVSRMFKGRRKPRLSQPALETLAIIAYKQPISRMKIESIRGVNCEGVLSNLLEKEVIAVSGRGEGIGKPYMYSTTRKFLEYLGLKDYRDLPSLEELERRVNARVSDAAAGELNSAPGDTDHKGE